MRPRAERSEACPVRRHPEERRGARARCPTNRGRFSDVCRSADLALGTPGPPQAGRKKGQRPAPSVSGRGLSRGHADLQEPLTSLSSRGSWPGGTAGALRPAYPRGPLSPEVQNHASTNAWRASRRAVCTGKATLSSTMDPIPALETGRRPESWPRPTPGAPHLVKAVVLPQTGSLGQRLPQQQGGPTPSPHRERLSALR